MHEHVENQHQILEGQKQNVQDNKNLRRYMKWIMDKMGKMNGEKIFEMNHGKKNSEKIYEMDYGKCFLIVGSKI